MPLLSICGCLWGQGTQSCDPLVAPYVIEPMNCLASREYDAVIFVGPARTGKTIGLIDGWVIYNVICDPADMLIIQMTEEKAREHSKNDSPERFASARKWSVA